MYSSNDYLKDILILDFSMQKLEILTKKLGFSEKTLVEFCISNSETLPLPDNNQIPHYMSSLVMKSIWMSKEAQTKLKLKAFELKCMNSDLKTYYIDKGLTLLLEHTQHEERIEPLKNLIAKYEILRKVEILKIQKQSEFNQSL